LRDPALTFICREFAKERPREMLGWTYKRVRIMADDPAIAEDYQVEVTALGEMLRAMMRQARLDDLEKRRAHAMVG
jgi:hypothetical protein